MKEIKNTAKHTDNEVVNGLRSAIEHRATWMALMMDEAKKAGFDSEKFTRDAIFKTGGFHGEDIKARQVGEGIVNFEKTFLPENTKKIFEMEVKTCNEEKLEVEFNYCPLVAAWKKQGFSNEEIELMCDCAMDGDRGIAKANGYEFKLGKTIAAGDDICEVNFYKK
ncbi:L-2-amino-thiazoline-4-carboxylic acid hydrolase [Fusibacter ferrireducens]|uniref:L-2-amino-thiazoline-4-carboxylic acid hydrolase n=1 Tax=Fusibacter ferrireducens TaxID=2785058 RepID=A0ABR9ZRQ8_9FIRM|nr:L-2-amino-thiazoline-4-carboxylic acid hydrolase [Fusibacter ferrireducens]MBF4693137.1 L-2-amino-thiazoline-4-carboxylic acid hydrolase [Fusibacter ferrireducens]